LTQQQTLQIKQPEQVSDWKYGLCDWLEQDKPGWV